MHISIQSPSGNRTEYFGVRDFETENGYESETITLHFPNQEEKTIPGRVISGINESSYTRRMLYEELDNLTDEENIKIVIIKSENNHKVVQSAMLYIDKKPRTCKQNHSGWRIHPITEPTKSRENIQHQNHYYQGVYKMLNSIHTKKKSC